MKRHDSLAPLSRDHHHVLVFARQLHSGSASVFRDKLSSDPAERVALVRARFAAELAPHFGAEERHLIDRFAGNDALAPLGDEARRQHDAIRASIDALSADSDLEASLDSLSEALTAHIRFEEREWFPAIEKHAGEDALAAAGRALTDSSAP